MRRGTTRQASLDNEGCHDEGRDVSASHHAAAVHSVMDHLLLVREFGTTCLMNTANWNFLGTPENCTFSVSRGRGTFVTACFFVRCL